MSKIILITGGSSYLGLTFLKLLLKNKKNIKVISTYYKNKPKIKNKNLKWVKLDINNRNLNFLKFISVSYIIHFAWNYLKDFNDKSHITKALPNHKFFFQEVIKQNKNIKKILVIGTCLEYGSIYKDCLNENFKPKPDTPYGIAKYQLYKFLINLKKFHNYQLDWCRLFYVYGNEGIRNSLWKKFLNQKNLIIRQPSTIRDFIHVDEISLIIFKMIFSNTENNIINICSGKKITIEKLLNLWRLKYGSFIKIKFIKEKKKKYQNFWGSVFKLNKFLNSQNFNTMQK